jgi:hypothetical protein
LPATRDCPIFVVERNVPRCRAASQVRKPVVPEARIRERFSEVIIVLDSVLSEVAAEEGGVYLMYVSF